MREPLVRLVRAVIPRGIRNWLRSPAATGRWLADTLRSLGGAVDVPLRPGLRLRCHPAAARAWRRAQVDDPEQAGELDAFLAACPPSGLVFDLGAHFGVFALAATAADPGRRAVAVDPSPRAVRMIRLGARLNGLVGRVHAVEAAAGAAEGELAMLDVGVQADGYYVRPAPGRNARDVRLVPVVTVDGLAARFGAPDALKVDVEGDEAAVLRGARATLRAVRPPIVFLECHNAIVRERGGRPEAALEALSAAGYTLFDTGGARRDAAWALPLDLVRLVGRKASA